jgi:hypothetical protein
MDLLEHPDAKPLLDDADLSPDAVRSCAGELEAFLARYLPHFTRSEQRDHARTVLRGKLSGLERKTTEPIARQAGQVRRPLQLFVGNGAWDDRAVLAELRGHVRDELGDPDAVWVLDGSAFPKKGDDSCGVGRQWCGRLGKVDNCQVGIFLAYAAPRGCTLIDARLYLPTDWAADVQRRRLCHVPAGVTFQESWRIALDLLDGARGDLPGRWVVGDDEFGRCTWSAGCCGSRPGAGARCGCGTGRRGRWKLKCCWRRCRPRTRAAGRGARSGWRCWGVASPSRGRGTRCPTPGTAGGRSWPRCTGRVTGWRSCWARARGKWGWVTTRCGRGWAGTTT